MTFDDIKIYLPKFLSSESESVLFEGLKDFPNNLDSRLYTIALKHSENIFQGDGIKDMLIVNLPDENIVKTKSMILSNSCDVSPTNERNFESQIVYAPLFNLKKYHELLKRQSSRSTEQINTHIETIRKQKITQIFYLPKIDNVIEDSIVFLDRINSCSLSFMNSKNISEERIFTLSDYGSYLFVYKLSIHFSRIKDKVDRNKGIIK